MSLKNKSGKQALANQDMLKTIVLVSLIAWSGLLIWKTVTTFKIDPAWFTLLFDLKRFGPIDNALFISHWMGTAKVLLMLLMMLLTAFGLGTFFGRKLGLVSVAGSRPKSDKTGIAALRDLVLAFAVGLASMSFISLFLGFAQLYYNWIFLVITVAGAIFGGFTIWKNWHQFRQIKQEVKISLDSLDYILISITAIVLLFICINVNAPELFFDSLNNHLAVAQHYLIKHGIRPIPTMFFANMPFGIEMLYNWALMLTDERLCKMIHAFLGLLTGVMVFVAARRFTTPKYALWAFCLFLTIPVVSMNMMESGIDVGSSFFAIVAFDQLLAWFEKKINWEMS